MSRKLFLPKILSYLMVILMGVAVVSLILLPWIVKQYINTVYLYTQNDFVKYYFLIVLYICGVLSLIVLIELRRIFSTCINGAPFVRRNVVSLKRIGSVSLVIGLVFVTKAIFFNTFLTLIIIFVFLLAALFCFVLADVFEEAVNHKMENDLTI